MSQPIRDPTTTISLLKLSWTALSSAAETGGAIITSYDVQWDGGTSGANWYHLQGFGSPDLSTSIEVTSGVVAGNAYQVKVRAQNVYGFGQDSAATTIRAAQAPAQVSQPTLASTNSGLNVVLSWTAPDSNYDALDAYRILIRQSDGVYSADTVNCDGATDANIVSGAACMILMTVFRVSPYSLIRGAQIFFTVASQNSYGWSLTFQLNTATIAQLETVPETPP
jgi:hypothetical protein